MPSTANSYYSNINHHSDNEVKNHFAANDSISYKYRIRTEYI